MGEKFLFYKMEGVNSVRLKENAIREVPEKFNE